MKKQKCKVSERLLFGDKVVLKSCNVLYDVPSGTEGRVVELDEAIFFKRKASQ